MSIMDCHLHSSLSFDSQEPMENYVKAAKAKGDKYFITTEHMDLESNFAGREDIVADFELQHQMVKDLSAKYDMEVLFGIEVGWREDIHSRNLEIVQKYPFDMVIMSVHESLECDVASPGFSSGRAVDDCYDEYLSLILQALQNFDDFDTLGHFDYLLRYIGHTDMANHREKLTEILSLLIAKDKCLEINTKMLHTPQAVERLEYVLKLYTALGGNKVTIGSDAHRLKYWQSSFPLATELLKKHGIDAVYVFKGRKGHKIPI